MQHNNIIKNFLYLAILTTVVVLTWIITTVWFSFTESTTPPETNQYADPIEPEFDMETMDLLNQRLSVPVNLSDEGNYISDPEESEATESATPISNPDTEEVEEPVITQSPAGDAL